MKTVSTKTQRPLGLSSPDKILHYGPDGLGRFVEAADHRRRCNAGTFTHDLFKSIEIVHQ